MPPTKLNIVFDVVEQSNKILVFKSSFISLTLKKSTKPIKNQSFQQLRWPSSAISSQVKTLGPTSYDTNSTIVPSSSYNPSSVFVPSFVPILVSSSYDDSEDENPPPFVHLPADESIEPEPVLVPGLPRWSIQHEKQLVILSVILYINVKHILSSSDPLLFWIKFHRLMIQRHL
jgi:hypothetical protein